MRSPRAPLYRYQISWMLKPHAQPMNTVSEGLIPRLLCKKISDNANAAARDAPFVCTTQSTKPVRLPARKRRADEAVPPWSSLSRHIAERKIAKAKSAKRLQIGRAHV